ncbi:MAG TPA: nodulation protein NfeD [Bacteroidota bacterium]|jgi:membrane-bound serine protease (ClpP class)|nr:nodulation protein NfeD [Bacteroidota bacterium]
MVIILGRFSLVTAILIGLAAFAHSQSRSVRVLTIDGTINPSSADYIHEQILRADEAHAECLIIRLNTPGGLLKSTRVIVSDFLASPLPVVVFVAPAGSQAASAGVFVTLASHVAVMAPGTNIGAAHPVTVGEQMDSIMMQKSTNDAAAFIRTISEKRHRNIRWAEDAVRKSISITETEALNEHIIDTIATDITRLLAAIDGREIQTSAGMKILRTKDADVVNVNMSFVQQLLDILSDPNIAYIFMMLGIYGLLFELYNPGLIFPGIVGVIALILAFYSFHTLPINYAGLALIIFAIILFVLEIKITSHGLLTVGGVVCLILGSMMLIRTDSMLDFIGLSWKIVITTAVITSLFFIGVIGFGIQAQRRKPVTGIQGMIGEIGEAFTILDPEGRVRIRGELWHAVSTQGNIEQGSKVVTEGIENLKLKVRKLET